MEVSPLANVKMLKIHFFNSVTKVKSLKNVESLSIMVSLSDVRLDQDQLNVLKNRQLTLRDVTVKSFSFVEPEVRELTLVDSEIFTTILSQEVDYLLDTSDICNH